MALSGLDNGFGAPFFRVLFGDKEISEYFSDFKYAYDEEDDDVCTLTLNSDVRETPDLPQFQEKAELKISWGFIQGEFIKTRKIYVQDLKWEYTKEDNVKGVLTCTEKAVSLKFSNSTEVYQNSGMLHVANNLAKQNGLKAYLDISTIKGNQYDLQIKSRGSLETVETFLQRNNDYNAQKGLERINKEARDNPQKNRVEIQKALDAFAKEYQQNKGQRQKTKMFQDAYNDGAPIRNSGQSVPGIVGSFKNYKNLPQANRTGKQFLSELGRREKGGPYIAETRDDELIIKKRNFNQAPYKSYTWGGPIGNLLEFQPMTKNWARKQHSVNQTFGGWNAMDKSFFRGNANAEANGDNPTLSKFIEMAKFYKGLSQAGQGDLIAGFRKPKPTHIFIGKNNVAARADNTLDYTQGGVQIGITVNDKLKALEKTIGGYNDLVKQYNNNIYDSLGINPQDAFYNANNKRQASQLKSNPAKAKIYGDPYLKVGIIITILGISKKYSGNYYVTKCEHSIDKSGGFICDLEMVRHGTNIKSTTEHVPNTDLGRTLNNATGSELGKNSKSVPLKLNPKN